ncbi:choice-of-anchor A domain-containing protein, partial [Clostridium cavendishii DSM 21758]
MKNNSREFSTNAKRRKFKSSLVFILSIIMIVGLLPTYLAKATDNNIKLGDISHYNAIMFGDFTPIHAETEGAIGIQGNVNISETYTIGGVNQNHTGWSIGNGYIDNNGPTLLLGGDILGKVPTIMTKGNKEDLVVSNTSNVDKKIPETQIPYTKLNKDIIDNAFKKLQNQVEEFMIKAESFKPSTKLVGGDLDSAFKFVESNENSRVLVNSINRNVDYLNITESFNVPDLSNIDFVIIYSNATKINFNSDLKYNGVTVDGDNQIYSNTPDNSPMKITSSKIMYVFPRAQEIINTGNNALKGSIFAPNATLKISAKAVNGQMFLKNAIQENGGEIHNFKLNWDKWNSTNPPNPPEEKSKVKLTKVDGDLKAITSDTAEFRLYKDGKEIDSNKIYKTKDGIIEEINLGIGSYY